MDYERIDEKAYLRSHHHIPFDESVASIYPDLCLEWNYSLNGVRKPEYFLPYSSEKLFWICQKCEYGKNGEWKALLSNRAHLKQGCPACGYLWYDKTFHKNAQPITIKGKTDLEVITLIVKREAPRSTVPSGHVALLSICYSKTSGLERAFLILEVVIIISSISPS